MTIISGLTIGFPSFMLTLEPNFQRVRGRFLPGVLRRALPGGLTDMICVFLLQLLASSLLPARELSTLCTVALAATGLTVLLQVCSPFARYRRLIWYGSAIGLAGCFTLLAGIFEFSFSLTALTLLPFLLLGAPAVYLGCYLLLRKRPKR